MANVNKNNRENKEVSNDAEQSSSSDMGACALPSTSSGACALPSTSSGSSGAKASVVLTEEQLMAALAAAEDDEDAATTLRLLLENQGQDGQGFMVEPSPWCRHLDIALTSLPDRGLDVDDPCFSCGSTAENWCCLTCYTVGCGRHVGGHMLEHGEAEGHPLVLSYSDISVWCYTCQQYLHNKCLQAVMQSAHRSKFGTDMLVPEAWRSSPSNTVA